MTIALLLAGCPARQSGDSAASAAASAVAPAPFHGADLRQELIGGDFTLTAHSGQTVGLSSFKGKVVALIFGYSHCPDVCPTHLLTHAQALAQLPPEQAGQVQVLFISVDPERDTPELLARYVPAFNPSFIGLTGSRENVQAVMKQYGATAAAQPPNANGFYTVDHSTGTFLLNRQGRAAVLEPFGQSAEHLAQDIQTLLNQQP
ncbi:SCO family protein [Eikenella glucosivorans]|nr:SCO family protein [Eikenella glucosivorans]